MAKREKDELDTMKDTIEQALATRQHEKAGALAAYTGDAALIEGADANQGFSRIALFHGGTDSVAKYGDHLRPGQWFDTFDSNVLGDKTIDVLVLAGWVEWVNWPKGDDFPIYRYRDIREVPHGDLEWTRNSDGTESPPVAAETYNFIVAVRGSEFPGLVTLKKTAIGAAKFIAQYQSRCRARGLSPKVFTLYWEMDKNAENKSYMRIKAKVSSTPEPEPALAAVAERFNASRAEYLAKSEEVAAQSDDTTSGEVPF